MSENDRKHTVNAPNTDQDALRLAAFGALSPYEKPPVLETERFTLRPVRMEDARDLLDNCYSDTDAWESFHWEGCTSDFRYQTMEAMEECLGFWIKAYANQEFVRFAIVDKTSGRAVGTIEMFGMIGLYKTPRGILRLDIGSGYENAALLSELYGVCAKWFFLMFGVNEMITKALPTATERLAALGALGFAPHDPTGKWGFEHRNCWELCASPEKGGAE